MSEGNVAGPVRTTINRFAVVGIVCAVFAFIDSFVTIGLELASASETLSNVVSPTGVLVAVILVPVVYLVGIVFGVIGLRRHVTLGGKGLAIAAVVLNSVLLTVGLLIYGIGILLGSFLASSLKG